MEGDRSIEHLLGLRLTAGYNPHLWDLKGLELTQNFKWDSKSAMQFFIPIVALSGDACPLWAWQGFRSLDEETIHLTLKTFSQTTLSKIGKQLPLLCTNDGPGPLNFNKTS